MSRKKRRRATREPPEPIEWKEAKRLYLEEGLKVAELARRMGRSQSGVRYALIAQGITPRRRKSLTTAGWGKRLHAVWSLMKAKCRNRKNSSYKHYGARGIDYCAEWERFEPFYRWAMRSGYKPGKPLVLNERARLFSPRTCRWAPAGDRVKLRLRLNPPAPRRLITAFGETKGLMAWAEDPRCRVNRVTLRERLDRGESPEDAIALPGSATRTAGDRRWVPRRRRGRRPAKRRLPRIDWAKAERLYVEKGLSAPRVARAVGASYSAVLVGLKRRGLYRPRGFFGKAKLCVPLHAIWHEIRHLGSRPRRSDVAYYGARGVRVCAEWTTFAPFYRWAIESGYRRGLSLSRRDRRAGFSPENCYWLPKKDARKKAPRIADRPPPLPGWRTPIHAFGETKGLTAWSRDPRCAVSSTGLKRRLRSGMDPEEAITKPPRSGKQTRRRITASPSGRGTKARRSDRARSGASRRGAEKRRPNRRRR